MAPRFQSYRIKHIKYNLMPRFNFAALSGNLPLYQKVHLTSEDIPDPTVNGYSWFANVEIDTVTKNIKGQGSGYAKVSDNNAASFQASPKFACKNTAMTIPHYLDSILINTSENCNFYLHQCVIVEFYNFDG